MFIQKPYCMRMPSSNQRHVQKKKGKACRKGNVVEQIVEQVWIGQQEEREPKHQSAISTRVRIRSGLSAGDRIWREQITKIAYMLIHILQDFSNKKVKYSICMNPGFCFQLFKLYGPDWCLEEKQRDKTNCTECAVICGAASPNC
jgi:hypothetical protein